MTMNFPPILLQSNTGLSIWIKAIEPIGSRAVAFVYTKDYGYQMKVKVKMSELGLVSPAGYDVTEVFDGRHLGHYGPTDVFVCDVDPTGVYLLTAVPL